MFEIFILQNKFSLDCFRKYFAEAVMACNAAGELLSPLSLSCCYYPLSLLLYASVSGSLTGKSILSPAQHKSICVTVPFLSKHSYVLHSCDCVSAFTQHTEVNRISELLLLIQIEGKSSKVRPISLSQMIVVY